MYYIIDRQDDTRQSTAVAQPRTTSGVRFGWSDLARPACRHDPAWRNTGLRTAATACRGGGNARLRSSSPPRRDDIALRTPQGDGSRPPQCDGCIGWKPRGGVPEHNPALTQLCSSLAKCPPQLRAEGTPLATPRPVLRCTSAESRLSWWWSRMFSLVVGHYFDIYRPGRSREMQKNDENGMIFAIYH